MRSRRSPEQRAQCQPSIDRENVLKSRSDFNVIEQGSQCGENIAVPAHVIVRHLFQDFSIIFHDAAQTSERAL
jgi:hypothetical protein